MNILQNHISETSVNLNYITHIKIIDVVGSINSQFCFYDYFGNIINDPFPTPYNSSGFDLDAVGVINNTFSTQQNIEVLKIYPNPFPEELWLMLENETCGEIFIYNNYGSLVFTQKINSKISNVNLNFLSKGIYILCFVSEKIFSSNQIIKI